MIGRGHSDCYTKAALKWVILALCLVCCCAGTVRSAPSTESTPAAAPIEITCDGENTFFGGITTAEDNVVVRTKDDVVYCDRLTYNSKTKAAICKGNVRIYSAGQVYRGNTMIYNFETKEIQSADFRAANFPAYVAGEEVTSPGLNHYRIRNGFFTTDNREEPAYKMRAHTIELYPNDVVVMKNIVVYAGDVPVMWLPIYAQPLDENRSAYQWTAGYNSAFGPYMYNKYNWAWDKRLRGTVHYDMREKRGFAGGLDTDYKKDEANKSIFRSYYAQDNLYSAGDDLTGNDKDAKYRYPDVNRDNRYRVSYKDTFQVGPDLSTTADFNKWSDPYVTLDFFENEYQNERQPDNFIDLVQYSPHYTLTLLGRAQVNTFFETVERKPELQLAIQRQKIGNSPISYESESSITNFERRFGESSTAAPHGPNYSAYRYDTFHQFLYPKQYANWLNVTPRVGLRGTYWSDDNRTIGDYKTDNGVGGSDIQQKDPRGRFVPNVGVESSFKVSRVWNDVENKDFGIYGVRHVAEPFVNAQYIPKAFGADPNQIRGFDDRLPSTRLAPINFPDYNSIDSIDRQAVVRHGVRNKIQTKRDGQNYDLIDWVLYADLDVDKNFSSAGDSSYSNLFSDMKFSPVNWLTFNSQTSWNLVDDSYSEYNNDVSWQVTRSYRFTLGNRYIANSPLFPNSNLFTLTNFYRLNEHWQFSSTHAFEATDGDLQEQSYTVYRDLSAWQLAGTFKERYLNDKQNEVAFYLTLTLKAFPSVELTTNSVK